MCLPFSFSIFIPRGNRQDQVCMSYKVYVHEQYCDWVSQILIYFFYFYFFAFLLMSSLIPELAHFSLLSSLLLPIISTAHTVGSAHDNYGGTHGLYRPFFPPRAPSPIPTFPIKKLINFVLFTLPWYSLVCLCSQGTSFL